MNDGPENKYSTSLQEMTIYPRKRRAFRAIAWLACVATGLIARPDRTCADLITPGAQLTVVYAAAPKYFEGPTWDPRTARLYFTCLTGTSQILQLEPPTATQTWMDNTQGINGTCLGSDGRLLCAQGDARRILSLHIGFKGPEATEVLAGNPSWKMPNDLCQTPSGDIYFTTPFGDGAGSYVYRLAPDRSVTTVVTDMTTPNGIIASLDGSTLYVSDSTRKWWRAYPVLPGGGVGPGSTFFNPSTSDQNDPDGMDIDEFGNLYLCGRGGVWIVSPQGQQLAMVPVPEFCSNAGFGGVDGRTLYLTCQDKVYSLSMEVRGALWRGIPPTNQPPEVSAGPDRVVSLRFPTVLLAGVAADDGVPNPPGALVVEWSRTSGPGTVNFADGSTASTEATFPTLGTYVLRLLAFDGIRSAFDEVTIRVARPGDLDTDNDVDSADVNRFAECRTGAGQGPPAAGCELADLDGDSDIDQSDFGFLQRCMSPPATASDPHCAD